MKTRLAILMVILFLSLAACRKATNEPNVNSFDPTSLRLVEQKTGLKLPPQSNRVDLLYDGYQIDPSFVAKIQIPLGSEEMLRTQIEKFKAEEIHLANSLSTKVGWWNLDASKEQLNRQYIYNSGYVHAILSYDHEQLYLYIEWISY
jgi:hypothetical protein